MAIRKVKSSSQGATAYGHNLSILENRSASHGGSLYSREASFIFRKAMRSDDLVMGKKGVPIVKRKR